MMKDHHKLLVTNISYLNFLVLLSIAIGFNSVHANAESFPFQSNKDEVTTQVYMASAEDHHQGHSGSVSTEGLGTVDFSVSCNPEAKSKFDRGLALLHHMMYEQAEKEFVSGSEADPNCAMAYLGIAMTLFHPLWPGQPSADDLKKGWAAVEKAKALKPRTEREQAYIDAVEAFYKDSDKLDYKTRLIAFEAGMKKVYESYPDDHDAAALYALSHLATASKTDKTFSHQKKAGEILEVIYRKEPTHPGAIHYTIHAYDVPPLAEQGVDAARSYDKIAPEVPHALHMPSHIFVRLGYWPETISWNLRSADTALKQPVNGSISIHYLHAMDYVMYSYMQEGKDKDAEKLVNEILANENYQNNFISAYALAAIPARYPLEQGDWADASTLEMRAPRSLPWEQYPAAEAIIYFARGIGAARKGDPASARKALEALEELKKSALNAKDDYWATQVDIQRLAVAAWTAYAEGNKDEALKLMQSAADLEDSTDKHPVTPGAVLPARELLGDMYMESGKPNEALEAYEATLKLSPNRFRSISGAAKAAKLSGDNKKAASYYAKLLKLTSQSNSDRPQIQEAKAFLAKQEKG
jgi:tetratricopeptide (TPR) repeat protein